MSGTPEVTDDAVIISGPMGRGYADLPCGHHRAVFPDPYTAASPHHERQCRACSIRYQITLRTNEYGCFAQFVRLT